MTTGLVEGGSQPGSKKHNKINNLTRLPGLPRFYTLIKKDVDTGPK